jgi:peptidoglycan/xylan/chitin deacetylase (PgdA/CDA1 family)
LLWWDELAGRLPESEFKPMRDECLSSLKGDGENIRRWAGSEQRGEPAVSEHLRTASEEELATLAKCPGITLGSHTWSHPNLRVVGEPQLRDELSRSLNWLKSRFSAFVPWLAYPYGLYSQAVADGARDAGYQGAFGVSGGWLPVGTPDPYTLPRLNISRGLSENGFALRLCGLFC